MASKTTSATAAPATGVPLPVGTMVPSAAERSRRGYRETVDALVVAFVLAFLIRTFQAEAFVIPTGSMAPTLMGRHKDVFCPQCGVRYQVNSSDDIADTMAALQREVAARRLSARDAQRHLAGTLAVGGECPQCRFVAPLSSDTPRQLLRPADAPPSQTADFSGDRLVVSKSAYSFADPERWDVAVFKYPGNSQTNYIKRIVALPGEELRVFQGDLYVRPLGGDADFAVARKPPAVVLATRQFVHDTHHEPRALVDAGWPLAWSGEDSWSVTTEPASAYPDAATVRPAYSCEAPEGETRWLRYRHTPANENVWDRVLAGDKTAEFRPKPQLVTDFTPYNTRLNLDQAVENKALSLRPRARRADDFGRLGLHWVADLILEADVEALSETGELSLDLVEAGTHYGVTIDVATGDAALWRRSFESDDTETIAKAPTPVRGRQTHSVRLANVDNQLLLWIDGALVDADASYEAPDADAEGLAAAPRSSDSDAGDLAPAGVGLAGGKAVLRRLRLWRDGYYLATSHEEDSLGGFATDLPPEAFDNDDRRSWGASMLAIADTPDLWYALASRRRVDFPVQQGQLFVMGDNSGWSLDARLWAGGNGRDGGKPGGAYLERTQLVGKAICVYWPHSWYSLPLTGRRVPAWPNVRDMRLVR